MQLGAALSPPRCGGAARSWCCSKYCRAHRALGRIAIAPFLAQQCRRERAVLSAVARLAVAVLGQALSGAVGQGILRFKFVFDGQPFAITRTIEDEPLSDITREVDYDAAQDNAAAGRTEIDRVRHVAPRRFTRLRQGVQRLWGRDRVLTGGDYGGRSLF